MPCLSYEKFLEKYDDDLYVAYMETGAYYDTDREDFDYIQYEDYVNNRGLWVKRQESSTLARVL